MPGLYHDNFLNLMLGPAADSTPHSGFVVLVKNGKALFVKHLDGSGNPTGTYGLPGGRIEANEPSDEAVARELFEETGITAKASDFTKLGTWSTEIETKRGMETWKVDLYLCRKFIGEIEQKEKGETPAWLRIDDVLRGKFKMPKMSREYFSFILETLRNQR